MNTLKKLAIVLMITPLFAACSSGPSESEVEGLIQAQYDQANSMMDDVMAQAGQSGNDEMTKSMSGMMAGMIPKLEKVENVSCDTTEGDTTYLCTADVTQTVGGKSRTDKGTFKVNDVNGEWVLGM